MMSQNQFDSLLDQVKNQMVSSIKEWIIPYVDKLANNQSQGQQRSNEEIYAYMPSKNGFEQPRIGENQSWYEPMRNKPFKFTFSSKDKAPMYNGSMPQNGPSTFEVGASSHNFQFNPVKGVSNPTFEPRNSSIEGNGRPFVGQNRQTRNTDYNNQIPVVTQPLPTKIGIGTQANTISLPNIGPYQPQQAIPRDQIANLIEEMCGPIAWGVPMPIYRKPYPEWIDRTYECP